MNLRDKYLALAAMRDFVEELPPEQVSLFHQIAARYRGEPDKFKAAILEEFRSASAAPALPDLDAEMRTLVFASLGKRSSSVWVVVDRVKEAWPMLATATRLRMVGDIREAIERRQAGTAAEVFTWQEICGLPVDATVSLSDLREAAAQAAFDNYDFGAAEIEQCGVWVYSFDEWTRVVLFRSAIANETEAGHFSVAFEPDTAIVRDCGAMLDGIAFAAVVAPAP
jgi:hypothetical protein